MSQGKGIYISQNLQDISNPCSSSNDSYVVSKYIVDPLLINNLKFDLRVYVLVTSYDPCLRAYVYKDGLVRFATEPYSLNLPFA